MNFENMLQTDLVSALNGFKKRAQDKIDFIKSKQDDVSLFLQLLDPEVSDVEDYGANVVNSITNIFPIDGITLADLSGRVHVIKSIIVDNTIYIIREYFSTIWVQQELVRITVNSENSRKIDLVLHEYATTAIPDQETFENLLCLNFGEGLSELLFTNDIITACISGKLNNVTDFDALFKDKVESASPLFIEFYSQYKDMIIGAVGGGVGAVMSALAGKLNSTSQLSAISNEVFVQTSESIWKMTTITWGTVAQGAFKAAEFIGQALLFIGAGWLKLAGIAINTIGSIFDRLNDTVTTENNSVVDESGFMNSWYGNTTPRLVSGNTVTALKVTNFPIKMVNGCCTMLLTMDENQDIYERYYDYALLDYGTVSALVEFCENYLGYSLDGSSMVTQQIPQITITSALDELADIVARHSISQKTFDSYSDSDKCKSLMASTLLFALYFDSAVLYTGVKYVWCNITAMNALKIQSYANSTASFSYNDVMYTAVGSTFSAMLYGSCKLGAITDYELAISYRNAFFTKINLEQANNTSEDLLISRANYYITLNYVAVMNGVATKLDGMSWPEGYRTSDWNRNLETYYKQVVEVSGLDSIVRYYPPQITNNLATFIKVFAVSVAICAAIGLTIYGISKITNGKRQAKLYSEWSSATDEYKQNPSKQSYKNMKKATRKLNKNVKLFGSSKYLSTLSGAKFGWDSDGGSSTDSTLLSSINATNSQNELSVIYSTITGNDI